MNVLPINKQVTIISALVEGCSIRATERMTGSHRDTIMRLGVRVGEACGRLHHDLVQNLNVSLLQADEIWSFIGKKQRHLTETDGDDKGDCYTFIGMDSLKKAIVSYRVGKRDGTTANNFAADLRFRILNRPQISTDGYGPYISAIEKAFGGDVDYAMVIKKYEGDSRKDSAHRYSPGHVTETEKRVIQGNPNLGDVSTSHIERQNLTVRMHQRRFTRLTNAFSKKLQNHEAAVSLYVAWYNFCRVHESLRVTPAMEMGVTGHVWTIGELILAATSIPEDAPSAPAAPTEPELKGFSAAQAKRLTRGRSKRPSSPRAEQVGRATSVSWLRVVDGGADEQIRTPAA